MKIFYRCNFWSIFLASVKISTKYRPGTVWLGNHTVDWGTIRFDWGNHTVWLGNHTVWLGNHTVWLGNHTVWLGNHTVWLGNHTVWLGNHTVWLGNHTVWLGNHTVWLGNHTVWLGNHTVWLGNHTVWLGNHTVWLGNHTHGDMHVEIQMEWARGLGQTNLDPCNRLIPYYILSSSQNLRIPGHFRTPIVFNRCVIKLLISRTCLKFQDVQRQIIFLLYFKNWKYFIYVFQIFTKYQAILLKYNVMYAGNWIYKYNYPKMLLINLNGVWKCWITI